MAPTAFVHFGFGNKGLRLSRRIDTGYSVVAADLNKPCAASQSFPLRPTSSTLVLRRILVFEFADYGLNG